MALTTCVSLVPPAPLARTPPLPALVPPTQFALFVPLVQEASSKRPIAKLVVITLKIVFARLANWPALADPMSTPLVVKLPLTSPAPLAKPVLPYNMNLLGAKLVVILLRTEFARLVPLDVLLDLTKLPLVLPPPTGCV